jgi:hypothetical protein
MSNKPTLLERYWKIRIDFMDAHKETMPSPKQLWSLQEIMYRIEVLEVFQQISVAAPLSTDWNILRNHYLVVDAYAENLKKERDLPAAPTNSDLQKQRQTALSSLVSVIEDYKKRYASYNPQGPEQYQKDIGRTIATFLPAWIQYRNTINEIKLTEENAA